MRSGFYVCPICGNVIHSMGEAVINCHGLLLKPCEADEPDARHKIFIWKSENEYFVRIEHDMTKHHYISFMAALSPDRLQMVKLYPEGNAEARFTMEGVKRIFFYCNRDGLFRIDPVRGIDDRDLAYDDTQNRRELEKTVKIIFG